MIDLEGVSSLADIPRVQAARRGEAVALKSGDRETTFSLWNHHTNRVADQLLVDGLKAGDRIAILSKNTDLFYEVLFGAMKARVTAASVNFRLAPPEIAYILSDSGAKLLFVGQDFHELAEKAVAGLASAPRLIALEGERPGFRAYATWRDSGAAIDPMLPIAHEDAAIQLYTSGTTGHPKGVELSHANYMALMRAAASVQGFDYKAGEGVINAMPQFHVAGANIGIVSLASGARLVVLRDLVPDAILALVAREKINHAFFVPAVILMLMQTPEIATADLTSLRTLSYGASPISEDLLRKAQARFGCDFLQFYGMTETTGAGTYLPPEAHDPSKGKLRSCGRPWPGVEVRIARPDGTEAAVDEVGEVLIKSPMVMKSYWRRPDASADAIRDGWMHTGDAAYRDADGYVFIYDRVNDMIVSGGENIYPAEVENAIFGHPDLADVAVIGVPDDKWGEAVKAIVVAKPGAPENPDSIIAWARERVAAYKAPKSVDFVKAIPRNASGKILRRELRTPYWEGRQRMVG
jgi:acyl-CoA synthetase (AMP-forming)/AMP-acid ligase II